jgi:hypothetical protein
MSPDIAVVNSSALAITCSLRLPRCQELHFPNLDRPVFDACSAQTFRRLWSDPHVLVDTNQVIAEQLSGSCIATSDKR